MTTSVAPTPWPEMMRQAIGLGLAPHAFWRLSLKEWRAVTDAAQRQALGRSGLAGLMARFPDHSHAARIPHD